MVIGDGLPKIIVPIVAKTKPALMQEVNIVREMKPDIIEWRVDAFEHVEDLICVQDTLVEIRKAIGDIPLLFTFRSYQEGGKKQISARYYQELNQRIIQSKLVDLIDVELNTTDDILEDLVTKAKENDVCIIMSHHDFEKTPTKAEMISTLCTMQDKGADILKMAVMPSNEADVVTLLDATNTMKTEYANRPLITMSMSGKGVISRLAGELIGSAATFASGVDASAPGQIDIRAMRSIIQLLHQNIASIDE